jgi:hypothetical protein
MKKLVKKPEPASTMLHLEVPTSLMHFLEDLNNIGGSLDGHPGMTPTQYLEHVLLRERNYIMGELPASWFHPEYIRRKYHILDLDE